MGWLRSLLVLALTPLVLIGATALGNGRVGAPTRFEEGALLKAPSRALAEPITLRVVTFNVADGYGFTNNRVVRMRAIAQELKRLDPDLVGLQEAFIESDRQLFEAELAGSRLVHHVRFPAATVGNGLWILSAHPIEEAWFHRYENGGSWWRLWEGDWWAGKGVGLARIRLPSGALLDFFDTHAQAGRGNPENDVIRLRQMEELARFVNAAGVPNAPALVVGDFNTSAGRPDYELLVRESSLLRLMNRDSRIDHIFGVGDPTLRYEVLDTLEITANVPSPRPDIMLSRAPRLAEIREMLFGQPSRARLSDHPGYLSSIRIHPR